MKSRLFAWICAGALLLGLLAGCSQARDENRIALENQWLECLRFQETLFNQMNWAFDYAEAFARENTWDSQLRAQAACAAVVRAMEAMPLPEQTMTAEQYTALSGAGVEAEVVSMEFEALAATRQAAVDTMNRLLYLLRDDVYLEPSFGILGDWIAQGREINRLQSGYLCLTTNYLLLQTKNDTIWEEMARTVPWIGSQCGPWQDDPDEIQRSCNETLDLLDDCLTAQAEFLGVGEFTLSIVQETAETGDYSRLSSVMHDVSGRDFYFPQPYWVPVDARWVFYIPDGVSGEIRPVTAGEALDQTPVVVEITCTGITQAEMDGYMQTLSFWGLEPVITPDPEADSFGISLTVGSYTMEILRTGDTGVITLNDPVACMIPEMYLVAILLK